MCTKKTCRLRLAKNYRILYKKKKNRAKRIAAWAAPRPGQRKKRANFFYFPPTIPSFPFSRCTRKKIYIIPLRRQRAPAFAHDTLASNSPYLVPHCTTGLRYRRGSTRPSRIGLTVRRRRQPPHRYLYGYTPPPSVHRR